MITVPKAAEKIIKRSRYLSEAMSKGFINNSSLARYIKPEIEEILMKKINDSSVIMALNRLEKNLKPHSQYSTIFKNPPTMITRSNLRTISLDNSSQLTTTLETLVENTDPSFFLAFSKGITQTTIVLSDDLYKNLKKLLVGKRRTAEFENLSAITIHLPKKATATPGVFYFFLKSLAWEGVNIIEIISTLSELTLFFEDKDVNKAFSILKSLFT